MLIDIVRGLFGLVAIAGLVYLIRHLLRVRRAEKAFQEAERAASMRVYSPEDFVHDESAVTSFEEEGEVDATEVEVVEPVQERSPRGRFDD